MRRLTLSSVLRGILTLLGLLLVGFALHSATVRFPPKPCGGNDCGSLFGVLPELILTVLGSLLLAAGTFTSPLNYYEIGPILWYAGWGLLCGGVVGLWLSVRGVDAPIFYFFPAVFGGLVGSGYTMTTWATGN